MLDEQHKPICAYGILYDNPCRGVFDFGKESSAFRGAYRCAEFEGGDLDYYVCIAAGA